MHLISHKQFNNERIIIKIDQKNLKLFMNEHRSASHPINIPCPSAMKISCQPKFLPSCLVSPFSSQRKQPFTTLKVPPPKTLNDLLLPQFFPIKRISHPTGKARGFFKRENKINQITVFNVHIMWSCGQMKNTVFLHMHTRSIIFF